MSAKSISLTFDVEEFSIPDPESKHFRNTEFSKFGTIKILDLLAKFNIKGTFFITGYFAQKERDLVKQIENLGHEIASHSYLDEDHSDFTEIEYFEKIQKSKLIIESIIKNKVVGFRVPQFSKNEYHNEVLKQLGFKYDSSNHPAIIPGYYYNITQSTSITTKNGITEIPVSVLPFIRFPVSWLWMRNIGNFLPKAGEFFSNPFVLYLHPWEFVSLPKLKDVPYYITRNTGKDFSIKFEELLKSWKNKNFMPLKQILK